MTERISEDATSDSAVGVSRGASEEANSENADAFLPPGVVNVEAEPVEDAGARLPHDLEAAAGRSRSSSEESGIHMETDESISPVGAAAPAQVLPSPAVMSGPCHNEHLPPLPHPLLLRNPSINVDPPPPSPPTYEEAAKMGRLSYVDFVPKCLDEGGILTSSKFERFDLLVARANLWLRQNPTLEPQSLETVEFVTDKVALGRRVDTSSSVHVGWHQETGVLMIKILRLWVIPKCYPNESRQDQQQIGYLNVVPACLDPGGLTTSPVFDTLPITLHKLNQMLKQKPLPGHVLNIECVPLKFRQYGRWADPDRCHYRQHKDMVSSHIIMLRIYYIAGQPTASQIGYKDFVPKCQQVQNETKQFMVVDKFSQLVEEADQWLHKQSDIILTGFQSVNCKVSTKKGGDVPQPDLERSMFTSFRTPSVLQVLRAWYIQLDAGTRHQATSKNVRSHSVHGRRLGSCTFVPQLSSDVGMFGALECEGSREVRRKMMDWTNYHTGLQVVSAETALMQVEQGREDSHEECTTFFSDSVDGATWLRILRVYVIGDYVEATDAGEGGAGNSSAQQYHHRHQCCQVM